MEGGKPILFMATRCANLSDDRFASQNKLNTFLQTYPVPEELLMH
jgi:hypothetical protein